MTTFIDTHRVDAYGQTSFHSYGYEGRLDDASAGASF